VGSEDIVSALRRELATRRDDITPAPANKKDGIDRNPLADEGQGDGNT